MLINYKKLQYIMIQFYFFTMDFFKLDRYKYIPQQISVSDELLELY